jgi:hypothetical protein
VSVQVHSINKIYPFKALAKEPGMQDFKATQAKDGLRGFLLEKRCVLKQKQ